MPNIPRLKRQVKRNKIKIFLLILAAAITTAFFANKDNNRPSGLEQPASSQNSKQTVPSPTSKPPINNIQNLLQSEVQKLPGTYKVYLKDLKTNQTYSIDADQKIPSASIYKLAVMYKTYDAIEKGELKKGQALSVDLTVEKAVRLMITISDNTSALLLSEKLGWANINNFIKAEGIDGFNLMVKDYPQTSAKATGDLLEKIYRKTAVSKQASDEMMALLLGQEKNDRIPLNLPVDIEIAHKTGELDNFRHDAGIVFGLKSDYIFVFLTETPIPEDAYASIADLSKKMFETLEKE